MANFMDIKVDLDNFIDNLKSTLTSNEQKIDKLLKQRDKTYTNFVKPLEMMDERLEQFFTPLSHLNSVCNSEKTQEIYSQALPIITEYSTKLSQNLDIYKAYKEILANDDLDEEQKRVLELSILDFELSGASLEEKTKQRLQEINIKLSTLSNEFSQNLLDATNAYEYIIEDEKDVEGIPQDDLKNARFEQDGKTKYRFTLQMPSYIAYMTYGKNRSIREELYKAYTTRAPQNEAIIDEILSLKQELSKLLGFDNYASYSLATKMAKNTTEVFNFLDKLLLHSKPQAKKELQELQNIAPHKLEAWDVAYYSEMLKKQKHNIDEEAYKPYFEQQSVIKGVFGFLNKLFGIEFEKTDEKLWSEKATSYDIKENNKLIGRLYLDLEARKNKRSGAWMHNFQSRCSDEKGDIQLASAVVVCNFSPSSKDNPSLLRHDDVVTFFHEIGHALHHILSKVNENNISGVNGVEWDAVEFPSQFLENFAYEKDVLKLFAKHYKNDEILPDEMIKNLIDAKNFLSALAMLRQLEFAIFDFRLHAKLYQGDEVQKLLDSIREETSLIKPPSYNKFQNGFSHIFAGGYAAGYYSYKWAEVLSADAFMRVVDEGIFDSKTAKNYKKIILNQGAKKSMSELFYELMQREAKVENLLKLSSIL